MAPVDAPFPTDQMACPHCGGKGTVPVISFEVGAKVWWNCGGSYVGYEGRVPCEVTGHSKTKQRIKVRYQAINRDGSPGRYWSSMVMPKSLEPRNV